MDVSIQKTVLALLADIQKKTAFTMIFITHDLRDASQISDDIIVMHREKIVERKSPATRFRSPSYPYTRRLVDAIPGT